MRQQVAPGLFRRGELDALHVGSGQLPVALAGVVDVLSVHQDPGDGVRVVLHELGAFSARHRLVDVRRDRHGPGTGVRGNVHRTSLDLVGRHRTRRQVDTDRGPVRLVRVVDVRLGSGVPDPRDDRVHPELLDLVGRAVGRPVLDRTDDGAGTGVVGDHRVAGGGARDLLGLEHRAVLGHHPDDRELVVRGRHADRDLRVDRERTRCHDVVHRAVSRGVNVGVHRCVSWEADGGDALVDVGNRTSLDLVGRHRTRRQVDTDRGPVRLVRVVDVRLGSGVPDPRDDRVHPELLDLVGRAVGRPVLDRTDDGAGTGVVGDHRVAGGGAGDLLGLEHRAVLGDDPDDGELVVRGRHADRDLRVDRERARCDDVVHRAVSRGVNVGVHRCVSWETDGGDALVDRGDGTGCRGVSQLEDELAFVIDDKPVPGLGLVALGRLVDDATLVARPGAGRDELEPSGLLGRGHQIVVGVADHRDLGGVGRDIDEQRLAAAVHSGHLPIGTACEAVRRPARVGVHPRRTVGGAWEGQRPQGDRGVTHGRHGTAVHSGGTGRRALEAGGTQLPHG